MMVSDLRLRVALLGLCATAVLAWPLPASAGEPVARDAGPAAPVVMWDFDPEEETPLIAVGGVHRDLPGPRPPQYPDFDPSNTAVKFDGEGARFTYVDTNNKGPLDFTNGDAITIEAWVKADELRDGENVYIIGKGRTEDPGFERDNQNWALRIRGQNGKACVSFLFATPQVAGAERSDAHWHRWTTKDGFKPKAGWHHVAATYRFGEPESVRGWVDGKSLPGVWDMGGPTKEAPVVDNDAVWIGSSMGGRAGNSFRGMLDLVALHRHVLDDKILAARFRRVGDEPVVKLAPEKMPELGTLPADQVTVMFHEGMPAHERWLNEEEKWPSETMRWSGDAFLLPRLPVRYDDWGIRESWKAPVLVRMAADVRLPPGKQTLLVRARALSRLWVDGKVVARTKPISGSPSGEEPITPVAEPPVPGMRRAGHREQEQIVEVEINAQPTTRIVLEALAGGSKFRAEPGELCVAVRSADGKEYAVLRPIALSESKLPLTEAAAGAKLVEIERSLADYDDRARRTAAASQNAFWERRHKIAAEWAKKNPAPAVPSSSTNTNQPIDAFLVDKIARAEAAAAGTSPAEAKHFHEKVLPILRNECFRCHGEKDQGGLRLDSRALALKAGDSELPAIVPGKASKSELMRRVRHESEDERMPPTGKGLSAEQIDILAKWIDAGALWPALPLEPAQTALAPIVGDAKFLRRAYLDTVGVPPTADEARAFLADKSPTKRTDLIDRLLADERWADHWISYWQDLLAENPTLINATQNSTGPFRWFLHDALRDNKPLDRMVTELVMMRGSQHDGGSAGFGLAAQNDAPLAAKAHVVAGAFLALELQCARCHDSPYHSTTQRDLYSLSAMLTRKAVTVPKTSSVPAAFFEKKARESLIKVTLKPEESIPPKWPFAEVTGAADDELLDALCAEPKDTRERFAALITAPQNTRFSQVVVNRIWRRLMGSGIIEPANDWEGRRASHPELLRWLANELVANDYSLKHIARLVMTSDAYQREAVGENLKADAEARFFNAPERRRLSAEQVVDSFFAAAGLPMDVELMTLDPDGRRPASNRNSFDTPRRSWMMVSLSNERDRPSLTLPRAAAVAEVLETFGWSAARQVPKNDRETAPNVLQPGALGNSSLATTLTRAAYRSPLAELAIEAKQPEELVDAVFLRFLSRLPTAQERALFVDALSKGFDKRLTPADEVKLPPTPELLPRVTWSNHLRNEANTIQQEWEKRTREGPPVDPRLRPEWRETYEDFVWSVVNLREFVWMP